MPGTKLCRLAIAALALSMTAIGCEEAPRPNPGAPCDESGGCEGGLACVLSSSFPGGYCSATCEDGSCPGAAICAGELAPPLCLASCETPSDCRDGYQCWRGACRPRCDVEPTICGDGAHCASGVCEGTECSSDPECGAGRRCEAGQCVALGDAGPIESDAGGGLGAPCSADAECASGICLPGDRGGVCTTACAQPLDCAVPFEAACAPVARGGGLETLCIPWNAEGGGLARECRTDDDCATQTCVDGQCTQACAGPLNCLRGHVCTEVAWGGGTFQGCGFEAGTGIVTFDLGEHELRAGTGTGELTLATPPDSVSVTLRAQRVSGDSLPLAFYDAYDPTDTRIFFLEDVAAGTDTPIRWLPIDSEESIGMLVPNTTAERVRYVPGAHRFRVVALQREEGDTGRVAVRITALVKRAPAPPTTGILDVDLYLVGVGVTAAQAPTSTRVQGALTRFGDLLSQTGITVGDVAYHDVGSADVTRYQVIDSTEGSESELAGLFRLSSGGAEGRLSLFLVRSISGDGGGGTTLGIAGGIPGPAGLDGTMHSGVVIAFSESVVGTGNTGIRVAGHVMAHEVSHFLGLFHTTERLRACGPGQMPPACAPFGATDVIGDTSAGDTSNLMNWSIVGSGNNEELSAGQGFVLRRSALVR